LPITGTPYRQTPESRPTLRTIVLGKAGARTDHQIVDYDPQRYENLQKKSIKVDTDKQENNFYILTVP